MSDVTITDADTDMIGNFLIPLSNGETVYGSARYIGQMLYDAGVQSLTEQDLINAGLSQDDAELIMNHW